MNFEQIWTNYSAALKSFLHARVSNPADVDDLLQDILIKTHTHLNTLKSHDNAKSWLFQIANNTIIDFYRKRARAQNLNGDDLWYGQNEPETQFDLTQCVRPFIDALPKNMAEVLIAIDIQGQSQKDYAEAHGLRYSTLKSRVQQARKQLRHVFDGCCNFSLDGYGNIIDMQRKSDHCTKC